MRVVADQLEHDEASGELLGISFNAAWHMTKGPSAKARRVLAALLRIGWSVKRQCGSHKVPARAGWPDLVFASRDGEEIGPRMLARLAKRSGLRPEDL